MNIACIFGFHDMNTWKQTKIGLWNMFPYVWGRCNRCSHNSKEKN